MFPRPLYQSAHGCRCALSSAFPTQVVRRLSLPTPVLVAWPRTDAFWSLALLAERIGGIRKRLRWCAIWPTHFQSQGRNGPGVATSYICRTGPPGLHDRIEVKRCHQWRHLATHLTSVSARNVSAMAMQRYLLLVWCTLRARLVTPGAFLILIRRVFSTACSCLVQARQLQLRTYWRQHLEADDLCQNYRYLILTGPLYGFPAPYGLLMLSGEYLLPYRP